jgi:hypothetical protein
MYEGPWRNRITSIKWKRHNDFSWWKGPLIWTCSADPRRFWRKNKYRMFPKSSVRGGQLSANGFWKKGKCVGRDHRVHRVVTADFWRTFHHEGKISPGWWGWGMQALPISLHIPSPVKLQCTLQLSGQIHWPCFISVNLYDVRQRFAHRVATATFLRTLHDGKISPGWWGWKKHAHPLSLYLPPRTKLWCTLQLTGQILYTPPSLLYLYMCSVVALSSVL